MRVLDKIGLTPEQRTARAQGIGGSDATIIASGDGERIENLRLEKLGRRESENLNRVLPVVMGQYTEALNCDWFEMQTGKVITCEGESVVSPDHSWRRATLDGRVGNGTFLNAVFQAKHVNPFGNADDVVQKYMAQVHHEMDCTDADLAYLSVFFGNMKWDVWEIPRDPAYAKQLLDLEAAFWGCWQSDQPWPGYAAPKPPATPGVMREVSMEGSNEWGSLAGDWLEHRTAAKKFTASVKGLGKLVEADVGLAIGAGIQAKRSKAGAITISEVKS